MGQSFSTVPQTSPASNGAKCPVTQRSSDVNPHNNIPVLTQLPAPNQRTVLSVTRTVSSIPRPNSLHHDNYSSSPRGTDDKSRWEYPSPQQFYNALLRKGWKFPEEHAEPMVLLHNRLNEDAWQEILKWESRNQGGSVETATPELAHFQGLHGQLSHKARFYGLARRFFPARFRFAPPFDRHDWVVRRPCTNKKVRYVIDYYLSRDSVGGEPVLYLDVRPALDNLSNVRLRLIAAIEKLQSGVLLHTDLHIYGLLFLITCLVLLGYAY